MSGSMAIILVSFSFGFLIGYKKFISDKMIMINSKQQTVWLLLLIFSMGMSIGASKDILEQLPSLGWKAIVFAVVCSIGSIFCVYLVSLFLEKEERQ